MKYIALIALLIGILILAGCNPSGITPVQQTAIADSIIQQIEVKQTAVVLALTPTITPTPTATATATPTALPTPTATWVSIPKQAKIIAPILLYHHIRETKIYGRYDISPDVFAAQMHLLKDWGYTSITISQLADTIRRGGQLPEKPVVITFDDGDLDVYQNAYPVMKELGFVGTFYIVANRIGSEDFVDVPEITAMASNGWEIGSHSYSHLDLVKNYGSIEFEAAGSRQRLMDKLKVPINSFAYPFGAFEDNVGRKVSGYGYTNAVGLGTSYIHNLYTLFYLSRMEIQGDWVEPDGEYDMTRFAKILPWSPVSTPIPLQ